jgi:integrase
MPDIVDMLLATGCRVGEVLAIRWTDVDLAADRPTVAINGTIKTEKGRGTYRKPKPKTDSSVRVITLPPFAVEVLLRRRVEEPANHFNAVFATRNGKWRQVSNVEKRWRAIREDTGLEWVTPHVFRKTVATLIDRLADKETAASLLGHSSSATTTEFYIQRDVAAPDVSHIIESFAAPRPGTE